jgi:N-acetylmuramoyl-L-alanine amidase
MIAVAVLASLASVALQTPAALPPLVMHDAYRSTSVPVVASADGPMLAADALGAMLPVRVQHDSGAYYTLSVWGATMQVEAGSSMVRVNDVVHPLASAPEVRRGKLMIPLQLVSEVLPTVVPNTRWDAESGQLVVFEGTAAPNAPPARSTHHDASPDRSAGAAGRNAALPVFPPKGDRRRVIVDAGHGGPDNGMTGPIGGGPRIYEKNITLAVALKLGAQLQARGLDVVYTRTRDTLIALDDRGRIANAANGDLFISVHVNAANPSWKDPGAARGVETYFLSEARTEDARRVEQMENAAVRFEDSPPTTAGDPLGFILSDMKQNEHLRESSDLADLIQQRLSRLRTGSDRGVRQAGFRVLVTAYMPAVLVEIGFGTNSSDAAFISDPARQDEIARAIADAAQDYLERYERRVAAPAR